MDATIFRKSGSDLRQALGRDALAHAIIACHRDLAHLLGLWILPLDGQRVDLLVEQALLLRLDGLLVAGGGEGVLAGAADVPVARHVLGEPAHRHLTLGSAHVRVEQLAELSDGAGPVLLRHRLHARAHPHLDHARPDRVRDVHHRHQPAAALPVQALERRALWEARHECCRAVLRRAAARRQNAAHRDVFHELGIDARARYQAFENTGEQVRSVRVLESSLSAFCDGCSEGAGNDDLWTTFVSN